LFTARDFELCSYNQTMPRTFERAGFPATVAPVPYLGLALLSQTGMSFAQQGIVVLAVVFASAYHLTYAQMGLVTTATSLGIVVSLSFMGAVVDRAGPRAVLFVGAVLMAGMSGSLLAIRTFATLLPLLFILGGTLAIAPPCGQKAIFTAFADRPRGLVMGIRQTGVPIGAAIAAWVLPGFAARHGLHAVYAIFAIELLIAGWLFASVIPRAAKRDRATGRTRMKGMWRHLARPALAALLLVSGQYMPLTYSIADLHAHHDLTLVLAGTALAVNQLAGAASRIVLGQLSDRIGGRRTPVISLAAAIGGTAAVVIALLPTHVPLLLLFLLWGVLGFGAVGWNALLLTWAGESVPATHSAFAMSLTGAVVFLGSALFPPLFGLLIDATHGFAAAWWTLAATLFVAAAATWLSGRRPDARIPDVPRM